MSPQPQLNFAKITVNAGLHDAKDAVEAGFKAHEDGKRYQYCVPVRTLGDARAAARAAAVMSRAVLVEACGDWEQQDGTVVKTSGAPVQNLGSIWVVAQVDVAGTLHVPLRPSQQGGSSWLRVSWNV